MRGSPSAAAGGDSSRSGAGDAVALELRRVTSRLVALGPVRLERLDDEGTRPADHVRPVLQALADHAADLDGRPRRDVPRLLPHALADQLVVLTGDLLDAAGDDETVARDVHARLVGLRRDL